MFASNLSSTSSNLGLQRALRAATLDTGVPIGLEYKQRSAIAAYLSLLTLFMTPVVRQTEPRLPPGLQTPG